MTAAVEAAGLGKQYAGMPRPALHGVDVDIAEGEVVGLLGPNGAGKSTLVKLICGVTEPSAGAMRVLGLPPTAHGGRIKREVAAIHQGAPFDSMLPVIDNLKIAAAFRGVRWRHVRDRVYGMLSDFGLTDRVGQLAFTLSGGEKRRVQVIRALIAVPRLLLLDEPSAGLDVTGRRQVWELITKLTVEHGTTVIWTSHYIEELERNCGRVLILDRGAVLRFAPPAALVAEFGRTSALVAIEEPADRERFVGLLAAAGIPAAAVPAGAEIRGERVAARLPEVLAMAHRAGIVPTSVDVHAPSLEDAFVELVASGKDPR
jgi:ABC-2 type transport system ATP-binding protein